MKKRILSLLLVLVMALGMFPAEVMASGSYGSVRVIVENTTYSAAEGAAWDGTLLDTTVELTEDMTMMTAVLTALAEAGHTWNNFSENYGITYLGSVDKDGTAKLAEMQGGADSGWMGTLNDWMVNLGFDQWNVADGELADGDVIRVMYTRNRGTDLEAQFGSNDGSLRSLSVEGGVLDPAFDSDTLNYTLALESGTETVDISAVAENKNDRVTVKVGETEYRRGENVPVENGTAIEILCGAKTYTVTVGQEEEALPGTEVTVTGNVVDITNRMIFDYKNWGRIYVKAAAITIAGAEVEAASEDGTDIYILLSSDTAADAAVTAAFSYEAKTASASQNIKECVLENGEADMTVTLTGKYSSVGSGTVTYTLHFSGGTPVTEPPTCLEDSDSVEMYRYTETELQLKDYFKNAKTFYLVKDGQLQALEGNTYTFAAEEAGEHTLVFAAANDSGTCEDYLTVKVTVKEIAGGAYLGITSSNGSLDTVFFTDENGGEIEGLRAWLEDKTIRVSLPGSYNISGKVKAKFSLTQNGGLPFITTKTAAAGPSSSTATGNKFTEKTLTLSGGAATLTFYFYNATPSATKNNYDTYTLSLKMENSLPVLAEGQAAEDTAEMIAGETYAVDLADIFTDADGDALTYKVSINGAAPVAVDGAYTYSTDIAGTYALVFAANDGKGDSAETYTVTLTVSNSAETCEMQILLPEGLNPVFHVTDGFENGADVLGAALTATTGESVDGLTAYTVTYPVNATHISVRDENWGGMAIAAAQDGAVTLGRLTAKVIDFTEAVTAATVVVTYDGYTAAAGSAGWLLETDRTYTVTANPTDTATYKAVSTTVTGENGTAEVLFKLPYSSPKTITAPNDAEVHLFDYNKYYDFTEIECKVVVDNSNGTSTWYFVTSQSDLSWRADMEGHVTEAGYMPWKGNITVNFDDGAASAATNLSIEDNSVLVNVNGQNHLNLSVDGSYTLKGYRAWEIIKYSYQNEIITPNFNWEILSGSDVISLTPAHSKSNGGSGEHSDWMTVKGLQEGT
ncbi:MAG: cadherin-like beta sandwich domain-containing protein, partial [Clostridia bacterium]|nr:cadherin-like beta sandwich domain-containing protein [Clostridia bacterium]